jgi:filamentous hemagglutinin family protein
MNVWPFSDRREGRALRTALRLGASGGVVAAMLVAGPANAQLRALGRTADLAAARAATAATATPAVTPTMSQIMARRATYQARVTQQSNIIAQANAVARQAALAAQQTVVNGLAKGGLQPVSNPTSETGGTGLNIWVGADQPTETQSNGTYNVTVNQTQSRALLSWETFNVGRDTALTFDQQGNTDWVVVNRVVGNIDPATGRVTSAAPTQILGSIKADGTVYVLDRAGILFGATSQINLHSLVASSLELGSATGSSVSEALSLDQRNSAYLQNGILPNDISGLLGAVTGVTHGDVTLAQGGQINATGGFVILAAPNVTSAGEIKAGLGGQVSLEAGTQVDAYVSSGAASSIDPNVRGLVLASTGGGRVDVSGSIDAPQGYISLGTDQTGTIAFSGALTSTTDVSRNGKIALIGGTIDIAPNAAIAITPDTSGSTIPQSTDSVSAFKTSQIDVGSRAITLDKTGRLLSPLFDGDIRMSIATLLPADISIGQNVTIHAPSADVNIGGKVDGPTFLDTDEFVPASKIDIAANAVIDVSGVADYVLDASRNELVISPAKGNELRDTPLYRDVTEDGSFTLNGATLYLDPRISGVRDDGVAWIGSPLVEAASLADQIGITAPELMTKGGNITLKTAQIKDPSRAGANSPHISVADSAVLDFSGGWVRYQAGYTHTTRLVTADGRLVDIAYADPNETYVGIASGFTEQLPQLTRRFASVRANNLVYQEGYSEGRDAGSLSIIAPTLDLEGTLHGEAVAGSRQVAAGKAASGASSLTGDVRNIQASTNELPAGGLLRISALLGGNIVVGSSGEDLSNGTIHLSDSMLSAAGLSGLSLQTSGGIDFTAGSSLTMAPGGAVSLDAGRTISFSGEINAAGGSITAQTYYFAEGSIYTTDDDFSLGDLVSEPDTSEPGMFDIIVNPGAVLSVRGRWVNDSTVTDGIYGGSGYISGGTISLTSAPHILGFLESDPTHAVDLSGSVLVKAGSLLDLSAGGYVSSTGALTLTGRGGDLSLINQSMFFQLSQVNTNDQGGLSSASLFQSDLTTFLLTSSDLGYSSAVTPDKINSRVELADGTVRAFGFSGGGTFALVTPDLNFGNSGGTGTAVGLDFLEKTGFGTLDLTAWNTSIIDANVFDNGRTGKTGLLSTETVRINAGETLNLTQSIMRSILTADQAKTARGFVTGTDVSRTTLFAPTNDLGDYLNLPANLVLGGLTELDVFGTITGAAQASITTPKLYNAGTIAIAGGTITQREILPASYEGDRPGIGVTQVLDSDGVDRGAGLSAVFGAADEDGKYDEFGLVTADYQNGAGTLTVRDLISGGTKGNNVDRQIYYLGLLGSDQGILLAQGSVTDLSGTSLLDPLAGITTNGTRIRTGRMIDGGTIQALGRLTPSDGIFAKPALGSATYTGFGGAYKAYEIRAARGIFAETGSAIDLSGASAVFDIRTSTGVFAPTAMWSSGGTLSALGGGDINGATIDAHGGDTHAQGGTLEWLSPTLVQNASDAVGSTGLLSADQIEASGFDSFIARGKLTNAGDVDLTLGRSFVLKAPDFLGAISASDNDPYYDTTIDGTGNLSIAAPHISLIGVNQLAGGPNNITVPIGAAMLTLRSSGGIDIAGGIGVGLGFSDVVLDAAGDIRLIGVAPAKLTFAPDSGVTPSLSGAFVVGGDLLMRAAQIYATTGTGNLQPSDADDAAAPTPFLIASYGGFSALGQTIGKAGATIRFERSTDATPTAPLSAGSYIEVLAENIEQAGILRAPLGRIDLGVRTDAVIRIGDSVFAQGGTKSVTLEDGSITSVSAAGLSIPYGTTVDLTEYYFSATSSTPITALPTAELRLGADTITTAEGAVVDMSGGGSVYAYEFVSGTGGSHDVLSRYNSDIYSSNGGLSYADGRQVYAILPVSSAGTAALYDPIYSSDYSALYGAAVGKTVHLDGANGLPAGDYLLLPAKYALLPGAMRLVENVGTSALPIGTSGTLLDGSIVVGGVYGVAGTDLFESTRRSFTVQSQSTFLQYSRIETTDAATAFTNVADKAGLVVPRLPNDAARLVLDPGTSLSIGSAFKADPGEGGRGSQVDIVGDIITVLSQAPAVASANGVVLLTSDLDNLNASSLLIGGLRTDKSDGTTAIDVRATNITVATDANNPLTAPEILLAVAGATSSLNIVDGASIVATGTLADTRSGDYDLTVAALDSNNAVTTQTTVGSFLRVANGVERFADRIGALDTDVSRDTAAFVIGKANISGQSATFDASRNLSMATAKLQLQSLALSSDSIFFSSRAKGLKGLIISPALEASLLSVGKLTLRSPTAIGFTPGNHVFNDLAIDAPGLRLLKAVAGRKSTNMTVSLTTDALTLSNSFGDLGACTKYGALACNAKNNSLSITASSVTFGQGTFRTSYGFDKSVSLTATDGAYYAATGSLDTGSAALNITTPFLVDLGTTEMPDEGKSPVDYTFATSAAVTLSAPAGASNTLPTTPLAPGARVAFGSLANPVASLTIDGVQIRASAGTIDARSVGDIVLTGAATLSTPSYAQSFGDAADSVTVSASAGSIVLISKTGGISLGDATLLDIGGTTGSAGSVSLLASEGTINFAGTLAERINAVAPNGGASFSFDAGLSSFDLAGFVTNLGSLFTGDVAIRSGVGDLALGEGQMLNVTSLSLVGDGGLVSIAGTINTAGVNGGDISLYGRDAVLLTGTALLDAHSDGYEDTDTRQASAGDVILGVSEDGHIDVASGAAIDLSTKRQGNRLVGKQQTDPITLNQITSYTYVEADKGGTLTLRAPVVSVDGQDSVDVAFAGNVTGARDVTVEGYRRYDLNDVAANSAFSGVTVADGVATLDVGASVEGRTNFLADNAAGTLVNFIQTFDISATRDNLGMLTGLSAYHERPGVELVFNGDVKLASNWNLGAGALDVEAALAAGDMQVSVLGPREDGTPRYEVVPGHEAHLFQNYVNMLYRVGGSVSGAAGRLTLRASGDLDIEHSITDGFFTFGDQTDPDYIDYQLGGGTHFFEPSLTIRCGNAGCNNLVDFAFSTAKRPTLPVASTSISLNLTKISAGEELFLVANSPYSAAANSAAATGLGANGTGDPIGSADLFPLLADGSAVDSFSYRLVGGADITSANPLQIDRGSNGSVTVSGETRYALDSTKSTSVYSGSAEIRSAGQSTYLNSSDLLASFASASSVSSEELANASTRVLFGGASDSAVEFMREAALAFFADKMDQVQFVGPVGGAVTGFAAPFKLVAAFLQSTDANGVTLLERFGSMISAGSFGYSAPTATGARLNPAGNAVVRTLVRTGTGTIDIAAGADIDLRNGEKVVQRNKNNGSGGKEHAQAGGTAVYTAGHVVNPGAVTARVAGTDQVLTIDPTSYLPSTDLSSPYYEPTPLGNLEVTPSFLTDGGSISLVAGGDILGRRDVWSETIETNLGKADTIKGHTGEVAGVGIVGTSDQRWRVGEMGLDDPLDSYIRINAQQFTSGVGTLGGGDIQLVAGGDLTELTVALDTTMVTGTVGDSFGQMLFGGGNLDVRVGHNLNGGRFDISTGLANFSVAGSIGASPTLTTNALPEIRITDTVVTIQAGGSVALGSVSALGVKSSDSETAGDINALGYYTGTSAISIVADGTVSIATGPSYNPLATTSPVTKVLPSSLEIASFDGNIDLGALDNFLYPSATGQLSLLAGGTLISGAIDVDDGDASLLPGLFSAFRTAKAGANDAIAIVQGRAFYMPAIFPTSSDGDRRLLHYEAFATSRDDTPIRIAVGGDLDDLTLYVPKQARVSAEGDILNMIFVGQNLEADDVTRIVAGRDITSTVMQTVSGTARGDFAPNKAVREGNLFVLGGPGALFVEAGRDLGPFLNSATIANGSVGVGETVFSAGTASYAGGILAVGNDYNPWLEPQSADIFAFFGVANGMDFAALRETYVNPANANALAGDLFEQNVDQFGNKTPDRSRPIYSPILIAWMQANEADALLAVFGTTQVTAAQAYSVFAKLPELTQRRFLLDKVYFNELAEPSRPDGNSYLQYVRGYRAVDTLFPASLGYTANDLSGKSNGGTQVETGNLDLRLAAIETTRGSNITILGPGGNAILGSVVRTSAQAASRAYQPQVLGSVISAARPTSTQASFQVQSIPLGYEGVLTLRGGTIHSFTDGDLRLNQSRLFSQQSGDIVLWSSNGDLNAGQGPKSAANVPPIVLRFNTDGGAEVDAAGGVTGAGIAGFAGIRRFNASTGQYELVDLQNDPDAVTAGAQLADMDRGATIVVNGKTYVRDLPSITLIAPAGTVDAGDAGVRASGDIFVAAAQIANADNFKVGGASVGIPTMSLTAAPVVPANAAAAVTANMFKPSSGAQADSLSRISVDVLGFYTFNSGCADDSRNCQQ